VFSSHAALTLLISTALLAPPAFASAVNQPTTNHKSSSRRLIHSRHRSHRVRGQQAIDPERVTQIQDALIHAHYLTGDADGKWDATTIAAMQKYQADHGWQTKLMPDSRALKSLGLGADYSDAINAKGSNFNSPTTPTAAGDAPASQTAGFTAGSGVNQ
jgi:peptidoglycan hydrolase-like protein with peptidoglycan-binding domain